MTNLNLSDVRIFLCLTPIRMQFSFDTLMGLAQADLQPRPVVGPLVPVRQSQAQPDQDLVLGSWTGFAFGTSDWRLAFFNCRWPRKVTKASSSTSRQLSQLLGGLDLAKRTPPETVPTSRLIFCNWSFTRGKSR